MRAATCAAPGPAPVAGPAIDLDGLIGIVLTSVRAVAGIEPGARFLGEAGEDEDARLLAAVGQGDERAFRALMDRHLDRIHAFALRFTGRPADAEDIAQETFLRVWRKAGSYRPAAAKATTWLHAIAANLCIDHARRAKLRAWLPFGETGEAADEAPWPEAEVAGRDALRAVSGAIAKLPARQRLALVLSVTAGHANAEIADMLGMTTGAVEQAIFRARKTLREQFDGRL